MTLDLDRIEKLVAEASPGPWFAGSMNDCVFVIDRQPRGNTDYAPHGGDPETRVITKVGPSRIDGANAAFIAAARSDVPALVARVRELEGANVRAAEILDRFVGNAPWIGVPVDTEAANYLGQELQHVIFAAREARAALASQQEEGK